MMLSATVILGAGIGLFKAALLGNDPCTAMVIALGNTIGINFSIVLWAVNTLWFIMELVWGRKYVGPGTFFNWFLVGPVASAVDRMVTGAAGVPQNMASRFLVMLAGILVLSFAVALYQTADLGIAPYDALSLMISDRTKLSYAWSRMLTDAVCTVIALIFGGIIGIGTFVCALGLGPFINFFTKHFAVKLVGGGRR